MYRLLIILFIIPMMNSIPLEDDMLLYWKRLDILDRAARFDRRRSFIGHQKGDYNRPDRIRLKHIDRNSTWNLPSTDPLNCEPFTTFDIECNKCFCSADGIAYCTKMACLSEDDLKNMPLSNSIRT